MRTTEAKTFLTSFQNEKARDLVKKMMTHNYSEAILEHHPDHGSIDSTQIYNKCENLIHEVFGRLDDIRDQPEKLFPLFHQLSRKNPDRDAIWFEDFDIAYNHYKHHKKLFIRLEQLQPFLKGNSFCDIGCGGGDLVYFLKNQYAQFKEYAGIDVLDWRTESVKNEINFQMLDFSKPNTISQQKYDTLTCIAVLHHVGNTNESRSIFLNNIRSAITDNGRLIIEEDVILPQTEVQSNDSYKKQVEDKIKDQPLFAEFVALDRNDQKDAIIIIDLLANSLSGGVPEMAFPCGFKSLNEWTELFNQNSFEVEDVVIQGFHKGIFNRSSHVLFILKPK